MAWEDNERELIESMFFEDVVLGGASYAKHYFTFRVESINGFPCPHEIIVWFYYDQAYIPLGSRRPDGYVFELVDKDVQEPSAPQYNAKFAQRFGHDQIEEPVLSIEECLKFAYQHYTNVRDYFYDGERSDEEAQRIVDEVMGRVSVFDEEAHVKLRIDITNAFAKFAGDYYADDILAWEHRESGECLLDEIENEVIEGGKDLAVNGEWSEEDIANAIGKALHYRIYG